MDKNLEKLFTNMEHVSYESKDMSSFSANEYDYKPNKIKIDRKLLKDQEEDQKDYSDMQDVDDDFD